MGIPDISSMFRTRIEIQIVIVALVIITAVTTAGYLVYESMSRIVQSVYHEARPDNRLFLMKDISNDLVSLENSVRLSMLSDLEGASLPTDTLRRLVEGKLAEMEALPSESLEDHRLTDSLSQLTHQKLDLWETIFTLHQKAEQTEPTFSRVYSKLEEQKTDTITTAVEKKGFLRRIFGSKKSSVDTIYEITPPASAEIKKEVQNLESEIRKEDESLKAVESRLTEENISLTARLNALIARAEQNKANSFEGKSREVDRLAQQTYIQLALFSGVAVLFILVALGVLFNFLRKSRAYQAALGDAKQKAETLARAKERFIANVSHELRTPVNAIYGLAEQTLQRPTDEETKEMIRILSRSAQHLKNIVNDTLDFSKMEAGMMAIAAEPFAPLEACMEVLAIQRYEALRKGLVLHFSREGEIPGALIGDPLRFRQILINLVGNAIKFTSQGSVRLGLSAARTDPGAFRVTLSIEDTGPGIPEEDIEVIFDEFVQARPSGGKKHAGTGLGLAIVKKLVELQGGVISVKSRWGQGTTMVVTLPYPEGDPEAIPGIIGEHDHLPESLRHLSVLVADDDEYNTFLLRKILQKWGILLAEARNGREAVEAMNHQSFDIILMDLHMPEMNGPEAAKPIKATFPAVKIIAVTASYDPEDHRHCLDAGMDLVLIKPFREQELMEALIKVVLTAPEASPAQCPPLDRRALEELSGGEVTFLKEMVELFIATTSSALKQIGLALLNNDLKSVFENAHKMAASCKQIRADRLYQEVRLLEEKSRHGKPLAEVSSQFRAVESELSDVHHFLRKYMEDIGA